MTIEFWPRKLLHPKPWTPPKPRKPKVQRPKLPIAAGKARQMLTTAIMCGNHELASWIDGAVKVGLVLPTPQPEDLASLKQRLDEVMAPLDASAPAVPVS
jgi:hypothetical protein